MFRRLAALLIVLALVIASCTDDGGDATTTSTTTSSTTTSTLAPDAVVDDDIARRIEADIEELIEATEELRGLPFLSEPAITVLNSEELAERVESIVMEDLDPVELAISDTLNTLLGMLDDDDDLTEIYLSVLTEQVAGFYDGETGEMVVGAKADGLSAFDKVIVVHELVHALTDQHFDFHSTFVDLIESDRLEEAAALQALAEGDATYFQLVYLQELPVADQFAIATEALDVETEALDAAPDWVEADLLFPYDDGYRFVLDLVDEGGIAAVDSAYVNRPVTTEQILHPDRYDAGDVGYPVVVPATPVPGWEVAEEGIFGEWGLRLLMLETVSPGDLVQATTGWRGDAFRVLTSGDDVAFVFEYLGETERDAIELTQALIDHIRAAMDVGDGVGDGGGLLFEGPAGYAFLDRQGDALTFIASTEVSAGSQIRTALGD